ncbi:acetamidase/formamidase family protein [Mesobacillus subterraneus]|uniref:acetamidase/formamidase family protein n=1 Tax=Mesobacillus subterraneus TaxID=285983 RepID=UPI00273E3BBB|nr:acetamidase/formamidase family protein [Mesobacillus subterraneus]WLR57219.1 acetamidase/formamidase family protein [Mesobacillus subterraneus]
MIHKIQLKSENLHGSFSNEYWPILTVNSGDTIRMQTPDIEWGYSESKSVDRQFFTSAVKEESPLHPMIGPIEVNGAKAGMVLEVKLNDLVPGWYGTNWAGGKKSWQNDAVGLTGTERIRLDWELARDTMTARTEVGSRPVSVAINPFIGLMGVAPAEPGVHHTSPPRYCGGNIDCKELTRGSTLYLPISVDGAMFSIGDGHAAQGDGEVSGTAIECPMDLIDITLTLREDLQLKMPRANTPAGWLTFGFNEDLNLAAGQALEEMVTLLRESHGIERTETLALASVTVDLRVTQVVNGVKGVHAVLPQGAIR